MREAERQKEEAVTFCGNVNERTRSVKLLKQLRSLDKDYAFRNGR